MTAPTGSRPESQPATANEVLVREAAFVLNTYPRHPLIIERGEGVYVYDSDGRRYLDTMSGLGVSALGHGHPRLSRVMAEQAPKLIHLSNMFSHPSQGELAEKLCRLSGMAAVFFSNGGAEAVEGAMKLARSWARQNFSSAKKTFVALEKSYHGRSFGALSVTGQPKYREKFGPGVEDVRFARRNDIASLRAAMADDVCALFLEPIMGEGGVAECNAEFMAEARRLADQHNALLVFDEIQSGLGRTGRWFAFEESGVRPDVLVIGKPLGGGLPLSAFLVAGDKGLKGVLAIGQHGSTLGGSPIACRMGLEFLATVEDEDLLARVRDTGIALRKELIAMADDFSIATEARGKGAIQGLELTVTARPLLEAGFTKGLLLNAVQGHILRFLPPYLFESGHVDEFTTVMREILAAEQSRHAHLPASETPAAAPIAAASEIAAASVLVR